jgi:hypothetical protein
MSVAAAGGASADTFVAAHFRGTPHTQNLAEKVRLECVVGAAHVDSVIETIFSHEGRRSFVYVQDVERVSPADTVLMDGGGATGAAPATGDAATQATPPGA